MILPQSEVDRLIECQLHRSILLSRCTLIPREAYQCCHQQKPYNRTGCGEPDNGCYRALLPLVGSDGHFVPAFDATTWRYCVGTLDIRATITRQIAQQIASAMKLSEIASVNACCLICMANASAA